jgi:tetratricopeptide (TPR) repeat protein
VIALALGLLLAQAPAATRPADPAPSVLVAPPQGPAESAWIAEATAHWVPAALAELGVDAIARSDRLRAYESLELPEVDLSRATIIRIAEAVGATRVLLGTYETTGDGVALSLRILDVSRGTLSAPLLASGRAGDLRELLDGVAYDVALALAATPRISRDELRARHAAVPLEAWEAHARAVGARNPVERVRQARSALEKAPSFEAARLTLAGLLIEAREFSAAHDVLARVPAASPFARRARFLMGLCLLEIGRYREAAALYAALAAERPTAAVLNNQGLAVLRAGAGDGPPASELLRRAVDMAPASTLLAFNLGWAFLAEQQPLAAETWLRTVLKQEPLDGAARVALAWALRMAGQQARADEEWRGVVAMVPTWQSQRAPDVTRRFERILPSERVLALDRQPRSDAEVAATLATRGERLLESGDVSGALRELVRAAYLDPHRPRVHVALGRAYRARGERDKAENELRMALWSKDDAQVRLELATLLKEMGRMDEARREAERVLQVDPRNAAAQALVSGG